MYTTVFWRNTLQRSKVETFIGFSIRARKVVSGTNSVEAARKICSVFVCHTASDNAKKIALSKAKKCKVPLVLVKGKSVEEILNKENCKMFAITDANLNKAVMDNLDENYEIIFRGEN